MSANTTPTFEQAESHAHICVKLAEEHNDDTVLFAALTDAAAIIRDLLRELHRETERRWEGNRRAAQEYVEDVRDVLKEAVQICKDLDDEALTKENRLACGGECAAAIADLAVRLNVAFTDHATPPAQQYDAMLAAAPAAPHPLTDDPCPCCEVGGVCRTPKCGRLKLPIDHPLRTGVNSSKSRRPSMSEKPMASIKTLARYNPDTVYIGTGEYIAECVRADDGDYYLAADVDAATEALRAEVDALREALKELISWFPSAGTYRRLGFDPEAPMRAYEKARAALKQEQGGSDARVNPECGKFGEKMMNKNDMIAMYKSFTKWCKDNPHLDLDPRLHSHSGPIGEGGYISHEKTSVAFAAWRAALEAARAEADALREALKEAEDAMRFVYTACATFPQEPQHIQNAAWRRIMSACAKARAALEHGGGK